MNNADIAMIFLLIPALTVVYFGVLKKNMDQENENNQQQINTAALQIYFKLSANWKLTNKEEAALLGFSSVSQLDLFKVKSHAPLLEKNMIERISHLMNIYYDLLTLLPDEKAANEWLKKPNSASIFNGDSALNYMINGGAERVVAVHNYLDSEMV